ncbi:MAG TPA: response regulator [Candidatus Elarobacter sp.]|nr:response regulator [Candidatus Elarobacter sp.]
MRVLIADDEAPARAKLRRLLGEERDIEIVGEASTGREAVAAIKRSAPDLIFLDIQMPGLDGFGVLDAIESDAAPAVVFVTAFDDHALRAFDVGALDYLLKPYTPDRFTVVLARARARLGVRRVRDAAPPVQKPPLTRLLVQHDSRAIFLSTDRIDRIEADRNYVELHVGTSRFRLRATIAAVAARLDPAHFVRLNRSTIVRMDQIGEMTEWSHGDYRVVLRDGSVVMWSRRFRAVAEREFGLE